MDWSHDTINKTTATFKTYVRAHFTVAWSYGSVNRTAAPFCEPNPCANKGPSHMCDTMKPQARAKPWPDPPPIETICKFKSIKNHMLNKQLRVVQWSTDFV